MGRVAAVAALVLGMAGAAAAAAQEPPKFFPLTGGTGSPPLIFVQRYNNRNFYSEVATISTTFDLIRSVPDDNSRTYQVTLLETDCRWPGRFRQYAVGQGTGRDEINRSLGTSSCRAELIVTSARRDRCFDRFPGGADPRAGRSRRILGAGDIRTDRVPRLAPACSLPEGQEQRNRIAVSSAIRDKPLAIASHL